MATLRELETALVVADGRSKHDDPQIANQGASDVAVLAKMIESGDYEEISNNATSALLGFGQGGTLGMSDELGAGLGAALGPFVEPALFALQERFGNTARHNEGKSVRELYDQRKEEVYPGDYFQDFGKRYDQSLRGQRDRLAVSREEDPYYTLGGEVAGGMATLGSITAPAVAGKTLLQGAKTLGKYAAGESALAGYGYGEGDLGRAVTTGNKERIQTEAIESLVNTGVGAATGAATGFTFPLIAAGGRSLGRYIAGKVVGSRFRQTKITEEGRQALFKSFMEDIEAGDITPEEALRKLDDVEGFSIADLGPSLRAQAERVAQTPTSGGRLLRKFVSDRNVEQFERMHPHIAAALGKNEDNFAKAYRDLMVDMRVRADDAYGAIEDIPVRITDEMKKYIFNPRSKAALKMMNIRREIREKSPLSPDTFSEQVTIDELDSLLRGFDANLTTLYKNTPDIATDFKKYIRDPLREEILNASPELRAAKKLWSDDKLNEEAMGRGLKIFREDFDVVEELLDEMSQSEKDFFKIGVLRAFTNKIGNKSFAADTTKGVFDSPLKLKTVRAVFGGADQFDDFMRYVGDEQAMFETYKDAITNSTTTKRLLQQDDGYMRRFTSAMSYNAGLGVNDMGIGPRAAGFIGETAFDLISSPAAREQYATDMANSQARTLISNNIDNLMQPHTVGGLLETGVPKSIAGVVVPGLLGSGLPHSPEYGR